MPPEPEETRDSAAYARPPPDARVNVLLVDDEVRNLDVLESVLESPDYHLVRATSADQALLALINGDFAAIVLDIQLPGMTGLELAQLIKQRKRTQDIPILFLTAYYPEEKFVLEGYNLGAVDYLTKPINPQILRSKVGVFAELYRKTLALAEMNRALGTEVTQRRDAEEALRKANTELEARVQERTAELLRANQELLESSQALQRARDEAVAASRAKDDFLAALSHELRTPLNPVLMLASDAAEDHNLPENVRADFAAIRKNVEVEAGLIDDLLDLTRISRGKLAFQHRVLDVSRVLQEAIGAVQPEIQAKRLIIDLELTAVCVAIAGDPMRLQQIFWNVLRNAAKFTPEHGRICVRTHNNEHRIIINVTDTGIGMTSDEIDRIFEPFSQGNHAAEGTSRRFGGLGLGLTIARRLVEHHGGRISATSPGRGHGTTMTIALPLATELTVGGDGTRPPDSPGVARDGDQPSSPSAAGAPLRILLVEDHAATRNTLSRLLTRRRHVVAAAGTLADALALAGSETFDLLVSDIGLPDGDGCKLMLQLREKTPALPGIALSGYGMEEDLARSRAAGFARHFIKPINVRALEQAIAELSALPR